MFGFNLTLYSATDHSLYISSSRLCQRDSSEYLMSWLLKRDEPMTLLNDLRSTCEQNVRSLMLNKMDSKRLNSIKSENFVVFTVYKV